MKKEILKDEELIESYLSGDKYSLAILVKKWHKTFCEKAFWILKDKDTSKDVAQESWMVIINNLPTLKKADSFKFWALRIIYNKAIDAYNLRKITTIQNEATNTNNVFIEAVENEESEALKKRLLLAIQDLPKDKQDIIRLFYMEGYSLKEISSFLQIPIGTTKSRLFKAREKLKLIIKS